MINTNKATLIGLTAVLLWSSIVGLLRSVSDRQGPTGGAAMMYSVASAFLLLSVGRVKLRDFPRRYLIWGSLLFVTYELCLSLSIGYANTSRQAIEVGMVNYLWPTFTIVAAILFNRQKTNFLIVPGFVLSIVGICRVLGGHGVRRRHPVLAGDARDRRTASRRLSPQSLAKPVLFPRAPSAFDNCAASSMSSVPNSATLASSMRTRGPKTPIDPAGIPAPSKKGTAMATAPAISSSRLTAYPRCLMSSSSRR